MDQLTLISCDLWSWNNLKKWKWILHISQEWHQSIRVTSELGRWKRSSWSFVKTARNKGFIFRSTKWNALSQILRAGQCCSFSFWQRWCPSPSPLSASSAPRNMSLTVLILLKGSAQTIMLYPLTFTLIINCANFAAAKDSVTRVSTLGARQAVSLWKTGFDKYLFPQLFTFYKFLFSQTLFTF